MPPKALVAMSGGVDSSVALYMLILAGYECAGATMELLGGANSENGAPMEQLDGSNAENCATGVLRTASGADDAREAASRLGVPHYVFDFSADFRENVIKPFAAAYAAGLTPNPCVDCNRFLKFGRFMARASEMGIEYIATGHYARVERDAANGRFLLKKAVDEAKDQSYMLYALKQDQLRRILFPLGGLHKAEVREIAVAQGFACAQRKESQDICFVPDGDYAGFIERYTGKAFESGDFVGTDGNILGRHGGLIRYTVGQRKGLGLALGKHMYVLAKDAETNTVTLCEEEKLFTGALNAGGFNWVACEAPDAPVRLKARTRYRQPERWATVTATSPDTARVEFDEPQRAIAPGQAVVLYDGETVVGGGRIL